jgi:Family of unknown function (DUF6062)
MTSLPARDLGTVRLAELFAEPGCPLCHHREQALTRYIEGFMYESVNDVAFRATLDAARGFCGPHTTDVLAGGRHVTGGMEGSAILFGAVLRVRERELRAVHTAGGLSRGRRAQEAAKPPSCLVCAEATSVDRAAVASLMRLATEREWAAAIGEAALCLDHLAALMSAPGRPASWSVIEDRQLARIGALRELVDAFAHNATHDRRHLTTDEQTAATGRAATFLGGDRRA